MGKISYKEREKRRRETEILAEAGRLIREHGYANLNMDTLAEEVGISKPTLYQHFKSKEDLVAHVLLRGMDELEAHFHTTAAAPPVERLASALTTLLHHRYMQNSVLGGISPDLIVSALRNHEGVVARKREMMALFSAVVDEGKIRGEITPTIPTPMVVGFMFNLMGLLPHAGIEFTAAGDRNSIEAAISAVVHLFRRAIAHQHIT